MFSDTELIKRQIKDNIKLKLPKSKLAFFIKQGLDNFIEDIISEFSNDYDVRKIVVTRYSQIDEEIKWADICWFEWCDDLIVYASKLSLANEKKIICRLHSYEAFTNYPNNVDWNNVDKVIFVAEHIRKIVVENFKVDKYKTIVIPNGINLGKLNFEQRKPGYNIAYAGYINYKKGPMLLLQTFKAIYDKNPKYKLFIAGKFQDNMEYLYFKQMIKELKVEKSVFYQGWQNDLDKWLEDKNYILCTSLLESQNMSVMQAMAKGIKPIVHNFVGSKDIYNRKYIWNNLDEAINIIEDKNYNSIEYFEFIKSNYSMEKEMNSLREVFVSINKRKK